MRRRRQPANVRRQKAREHWDAVYLRLRLLYGDDFTHAIAISRFESHEKGGFVRVMMRHRLQAEVKTLYQLLGECQQPISSASVRYLRFAHYRLNTPPPKSNKGEFTHAGDQQWHDTFHAEQKRLQQS